MEDINSAMKQLELNYERKISAGSIKHMQELEHLRQNLSSQVNSLSEQLKVVKSELKGYVVWVTLK